MGYTSWLFVSIGGLLFLASSGLGVLIYLALYGLAKWRFADLLAKQQIYGLDHTGSGVPASGFEDEEY